MASLGPLNVSQVSTKQELHSLLAKYFSFPSYYGHNWDAFWECITESERALPTELIVEGFTQLEARLPREAQSFRQCLSELSIERPECRVVVA